MNLILNQFGKPAQLDALRNNWYEASRWSQNRSWVWYPVQDAKKDLDRFTRYELSKHARYLYKNSPLMRGLVERVVTLVVGQGFHPVFRSSGGEPWGLKFKNWWAKKGRNVHLGPRCSFAQYTRALARARVIDGEAFTIKTFDEESMDDRVQGIESDRCCGNPNPNSTGAEGKNQVDGILLNRQGTPTKYKFKDAENLYDADTVIHHFTPTRLGQYRGETLLAAAINTARDVDDILALEKSAVKEASGHKDIIKTASGELDPETMRTMRYGQNFPTVFNLPADDKTKNDYYVHKFGAESVVLKTGDSYTPYVSQRPGAAWEGFMEFLSNTICLATGFPASVILPIIIGGTDIRRDLEIAQRVAMPMMLDLALELDEILNYFVQGEIADGELRGAPSDWSIFWHFPQRVNIDRQMAKEDRNDVQAGLMSREEYHGRYGEDSDAYEMAIIQEVAKRKDRITAAGFKDVLEFVQLMSLNSQLFVSRITEDIKPGDDDLKAKGKKTK